MKRAMLLEKQSPISNVGDETSGTFRVQRMMSLNTTVHNDEPLVTPDSRRSILRQGTRPVCVLVVDDEATLRRTLVRALTAHGFNALQCPDGQTALQCLAQQDIDVLLVDLMMPGMTGLDVLREAKANYSDVECVMMTAYSRIEDAVAAVRAGAYDFLTKPFSSLDAIALTIAQAAEHRRLVTHARTLEAQLEQGLLTSFDNLIGRSSSMQAVYQLIDGVASASSTVLILGESGTGKELVARGIHRRSARTNKPFVAVNCSSIPESLIESELFGHVKGAFTTAMTSRAGLFELADHGTLFLDEVGDLSLAAQVKLLRALQEGEIKRVGSNETRVVDVRVIAATNVDLTEKISAGQFREDLYYRLNVIAILLPSLRERKEDIPLLAQHFLKKYAQHTGKEIMHLSTEALHVLTEYSWPGNVRQLENAIERAVVLSRTSEIKREDLPDNIAQLSSLSSRSLSNDSAQCTLDEQSLCSIPSGELIEMPYAEAKKKWLRDFDHLYVTQLLARAQGNISEAARRAGLDRSNFRRLLRKQTE